MPNSNPIPAIRHSFHFLLVALCLAVASCGGDDGGSDGGGGNDRASVESCLNDAGLEPPQVGNEPDAEQAKAGMTELITVLDLNDQQWGYSVSMFETPEQAEAYASKQQAEADDPDAPAFVAANKISAHGSNVVFSDKEAPKRAAVEECAGG
ncbi:MAG TPA: hypothetical protein VD790_08405 [Thermoleophilaceae bacterium]|nr:hypothetical protein [Thermoleophilaceae bacterium]